MRNIKILIAYDGSSYLGWQKTAMGPSIENALSSALSQILQEEIALQAASRTDAGVHAAEQAVNFFTTRSSFCLHKLKASLNSLLPKDIVTLHMEEVVESFHATLDCISKEYHYFICYGAVQLPQYRRYSWHYPRPLDLEKMRSAAQLLIGEHNFSAFCNVKKNQRYAHYRRHLQKIEIFENGDHRLRFEIQGDHFLYKMVRNIVGTLIYVGCGRIEVEMLPEILMRRDRTAAGVTAPAHGLSLYRVHYANTTTATRLLL